MIIELIIAWIICYILIAFAMCVDNICWISDSPEYLGFNKLGWTSGWYDGTDRWSDNGNISVEGKNYYSKLDYIFNYRIKTVLTHPRDIIPAIITSLLMAIIWLISKGVAC